MTREEAIKLLKEYAPRIKPFYEPQRTEYKQAIDMAIEALEREPSEDLISRAEAIEEPKKKAKVIDHGKIVACYKGGRSPQWIADDMGISWQTVVNHLEKEGIYKKI